MSGDFILSQGSPLGSSRARFSFASRLTLLLLCFLIISPTFLTPRSVKASTPISGVWTQSTQQDFQSDTLNNLDTTTSPGQVMLAVGGSVVHMGFPATTRASSYTAGINGLTVIQVTAGSAAPVSGTIQRAHLYITGVDPNGGALFKLKVFRDNGTYFQLVGQSGNFGLNVGENSFSTGSIPVQRGDYLGFFWKNATIAGDGFLFGGDNRVIIGSDITTDTLKSVWSYELFCFFFFCVTDIFSVEADVVPNVTGSLVSVVRDTGGSSTWHKFNYTASVPSETSLSFNTRTSNNSIFWSPWSTTITSTGTNITSPPGRYIQYSSLFTAQGTLTPILTNVTISYVTTPAQTPSNILISASVQTITVGGTIRITGMISPSTAASVILTFTAPDGANATQTVSSNSAGLFQYDFSPDKSGLWQVRASWPGNVQTSGASSSIQSFQVQEPPSFLSSTLPWLILVAVVVGFAVAVFITKPKKPEMG